MLFKFIYLAGSGLGCNMQDLCRMTQGLSAWHADSLAVAQASAAAARGLRCSPARGVSAPQPGTKPTPPALQGKFLTTEPPGKSLL